MRRWFLICAAIFVASLAKAGIRSQMKLAADYPVPIPASAISFHIHLSLPWQSSKRLPRVVGRAIRIDWRGFPRLYVLVRLAVPAGIELSAAESSRILYPIDTAGEYDPTFDVYQFKAPIDSLKSNKLNFMVRFLDRTISRFTLKYTVHLNHTVFQAGPRCQHLGIELRQSGGSDAGGYFFVGCRVRDRLLTANLLRPDELGLKINGKRSDDADENLKVRLPDAALRLEDQSLGTFDLDDGHGGQTHLKLWALARTLPRRWGIWLGFGTGYSAFHQSSNDASEQQAELNAAARLAYQIIRGKLYAKASFRSTVYPLVLRPNGALPAVWWIGLNESLGYVLPLKTGSTHFSVDAGWSSLFMAMHLHQYGFDDREAPRFELAAFGRPLGKPRWNIGLAYATIGELSARASIEAHWFWGDPDLEVHFNWLDTLVGADRITNTSAWFGWVYRIF